MSKNFELLAIATAYADAKGLPFETKTRHQIYELGGVGVGLLRPDEYSGGFPDFANKPIGTWSDDTQHTLATMESIIEYQGFDLITLARNLKKEFDICRAGWGGATKESIAKVNNNLNTDELKSLGSVKTQGCGPLMRLTPLAIEFTLNSGDYTTTQIEKNVQDSTTLTHNTPDSVVSTMTHYRVLERIIQSSINNTESESTVEVALSSSKSYGTHLNVGINKTHETFIRAQENGDIDELIYIENPFSAWAVQAVACLIFDRYRNTSFRDIIDATIEVGGDTDSTASLVAGMWVCSNIGNTDLAVDLDRLQQLDRLKRVGKEFSDRYNMLIKTSN